MEKDNQNSVEEEVELTQEDFNKLMKVRLDKLEALRAEGKDPFEITKFDRTHTTSQIKDNYDELENKDVTIAGRIMSKRVMGKASFCHIQDGDGKMQLYVSINDLGEDSYKHFKEYDIGDFIGVTGFVFKTKNIEDKQIYFCSGPYCFWEKGRHTKEYSVLKYNWPSFLDCDSQFNIRER